MQSNEVSKLSVLANAVASAPEQRDELVEVISEPSSLSGISLEEPSEELREALQAILSAWPSTGPEPTVEEMIAIAKKLEAGDSEPVQLTGRFLLGALEGLISSEAISSADSGPEDLLDAVSA
jgi:hypothetical protein